MASQSANNGQLTPWSTWGKYNGLMFAVQQALAKLQTVTLVRVESCTNSGTLSPVGFVNVTPLVNQVTGADVAVPHVQIYNVPYLRIQGGSDAFILDPKQGDLGIALFASRDISKAVSTKSQSNPGSARQFDFSDALYLGGLLNGIPSQYVRFSSSGIEVVSPTLITLKAPNISIQGSVTVTGDVVAEGTSLHLHQHTSESPGSPTSPPL